jgi:hypothetical protein
MNAFNDVAFVAAAFRPALSRIRTRQTRPPKGGRYENRKKRPHK